MAVYSFLQAIQDERKGSTDAKFNGYLEDYLDTIAPEDVHYSMFQKLLELNNDLRILVGYRVGINCETISNQIIRYKDVFKLKEKPLVCTYILYTAQDENEKAVLLMDEEFIYIKGLYYTMTEPNGQLQNVKSEMIAMDTRNEATVLNVVSRLFTEKTGSLQREVDRKQYPNYEHAKELALKLSEDLKENALKMIDEAKQEDKEALINSIIIKWFLLKKYLYVQYMINKDILIRDHAGNVRKQRNQAKMNSDEIKFISLSDLWKQRR